MKKLALILFINPFYITASEVIVAIEAQPQSCIDQNKIAQGLSDCLEDCRDFSALCLVCPLIGVCAFGEGLCAKRDQARTRAECAQTCGFWAFACLCCPLAACSEAWRFGPAHNQHQRKLKKQASTT